MDTCEICGHNHGPNVVHIKSKLLRRSKMITCEFSNDAETFQMLWSPELDRFYKAKEDAFIADRTK